MTDRKNWDAIVIGSGRTDYRAYLATNGMKTLVLEQHYVAGGNSRVPRRAARSWR
jgi:all-trans-retinol 13,14-reductase